MMTKRQNINDKTDTKIYQKSQEIKGIVIEI